ncbi:hypothetical protein [Actinoplanes rectilineatus]|uniref:hypothetical protein n=1 Tax=Actinoplanes rectilineatus TaxID=113571 RepID=UPI0005F2A2C2|nr:hypothetical protein [Actinoplanes rectilineatus]
MKPAAATTERLARLVLLLCTLFGFAALHTVGHAAVSEHHTVTFTTTASGPAFVSAASPVDDDDCGGDGCTHTVAMPADAYGGSSRSDVCVAILSVIAIGVLLGARLLMGLADRASAADGRQLVRTSRSSRRPAWGLAVTAVAVMRT